MKKLFKSLKKYFINLGRAIFKIKDTSKSERITTSSSPEIDKLEKLDTDYIKQLIDMTKIESSNTYDEVQEQFKKNRRAINEYKEWYSRLVGYKKPPETLQKIIDADLKLDRSEMNKIFIKLHNRDFEYFKELEKNREVHKNSFTDVDDIENIVQVNEKKSNKSKNDLREILKDIYKIQDNN